MFNLIIEEIAVLLFLSIIYGVTEVLGRTKTVNRIFFTVWISTIIFNIVYLICWDDKVIGLIVRLGVLVIVKIVLSLFVGDANSWQKYIKMLNNLIKYHMV